MKITDISRWSIRLLEALGVIALMGTQELSVGALAILPILGTALFFLNRSTDRQFRIPDKLLFILFAIVVFGAVFVTFKARYYPIIVAAYTAPIVHVLIWAGENTLRNWTWRIGVTFIEIVLATSISPDFYLAFVMFSFVVISSITLSCVFLENEFSKRAKKYLDFAMPKTFFRFSFTMSLIVFVASLLIFPILPRTHAAFDLGFAGKSNQANIGYTEDINLSNWLNMAGEGEGRTVLSIFLPEGTETVEGFFENTGSDWFYKGLLRGNILGRYDGVKWNEVPKKLNRSGKKYSVGWDLPLGRSKNLRGAQTLEYMREPIGTSTIFTPYGTDMIKVLDMRKRAVGRPDGAWKLDGTRYKKVRYRVQHRMDATADPNPAPIYTEVPSNLNLEDDRWSKLRESIFANAQSDAAKVRALVEHFKGDSYKGLLRSEKDESWAAYERAKGGKTSPEKLARVQLEDFLFRSKAGHCELYSTAGALLLRKEGIPARAVVGFKITRAAVGGVFLVREGDAHAWIEAFLPGRGWLPLDLTPTQQRSLSNLWEDVRNSMDIMGAYWQRFIVGFNQNNQRQLGQETAKDLWRGIKGFQEKALGESYAGPLSIIAFLIVVFVAIGVFLVLRGAQKTPYQSKRGKNKRFLKTRRRVHKLIQRNPTLSEHPPTSLTLWLEKEQNLRFGPLDESSRDWNDGVADLEHHYVAHKKQWEKAA